MPRNPEIDATPTYDAIVVGLGPAGSTVAYEIARAGRTVLALDRERFPRYKVCGGAISARVYVLLDGVRREVIERTVSAMTFRYCGQEAFTVGGGEPVASFVMRDRFDTALADRAARAGACLRYGEPVISIEETAQGVQVVTPMARYQARFLVGADGANSRVARRLNAAPCRGAYGLEAEIPISTGSNEVILEMGAIPGGYGWIFPKQRGMSIGIGGFRAGDPQPKAAFERFVALQTGFRDVAVPTMVGYPIPVYAKGWRVASGRIALVGDAARLVDPFFGEGIYYGILSGQHVGQTIVRELDRGGIDLSAYVGWVEAELAPEFAVADRLASIAYGYPRMWYDAMRAHPDVIGWFYDVLRGTSRFQDLWARLRRHVFRLVPAALVGRATTLFVR
jgi:geranylgeranyl reductase family protein